MIEVQLKVKEIYEELKRYAIYNSDLTQVCSFRNELAPLLKEYNIEFDQENCEDSKTKNKPILTITGKNIMKLVNAPAEMLHYVGVRSEYDPTIPITYMSEVKKLIDSNLVTVDDKFKNLYSKMNYKSKIKDLICANVNFYGKGKLTNYIDENASIQSLKINNCKIKEIAVKQLKLKVLDGLNTDNKYHEIKCKISDSKTTQLIVLRFYNKTNILKSIAFKSNIISIITNKITEENQNYLVIYDPIIIPEGLNIIKETVYTPDNRSIPVELYRNALNEFIYRYNQID